jgi:hypothetical protein
VGFKEAVPLLLSFNADVSIQDKTGSTALQVARDVSKRIVDHLSNMQESEELSKMMPPLLVILRGSLDVAELLSIVEEGDKAIEKEIEAAKLFAEIETSTNTFVLEEESPYMRVVLSAGASDGLFDSALYNCFSNVVDQIYPYLDRLPNSGFAFGLDIFPDDIPPFEPSDAFVFSGNSNSMLQAKFCRYTRDAVDTIRNEREPRAVGYY